MPPNELDPVTNLFFQVSLSDKLFIQLYIVEGSSKSEISHNPQEYAEGVDALNDPNNKVAV